MKCNTFFTNAIAVIMLIFSVVLICSAVMWFYPRHVIDVTLETHGTTFTKSEVIPTVSTITTYAHAESEYEVIMLCDEFKYNILEFEANTEPYPERVSVVENAIPDNLIPSDNCKFVIDGTHKVRVTPMLYRTYYSVFESNIFEITDGK